VEAFGTHHIHLARLLNARLTLSLQTMFSLFLNIFHTCEAQRASSLLTKKMALCVGHGMEPTQKKVSVCRLDAVVPAQPLMAMTTSMLAQTLLILFSATDLDSPCQLSMRLT
jgi:hypothetical protein